MTLTALDARLLPYTTLFRSDKKRAPFVRRPSRYREGRLLLLHASRILNECAVGVDDVAVEVGRLAARVCELMGLALLSPRGDGVGLRGHRAAPRLVDVDAPR